MRGTRGTSAEHRKVPQTRIKPRGAELRNARNKKSTLYIDRKNKIKKYNYIFRSYRETCKYVPRFRDNPQTRIKPRKNARNIGSAPVPQVPHGGA